MAVLPYGKSGVIGGAMLGLGRALGETLAVAIVLSVVRRRHLQPDLAAATRRPSRRTSRCSSPSRPGWT